jgi:Pyruvate/2-oxoacid:ferredoxin oxidoreductase delta subunit
VRPQLDLARRTSSFDEVQGGLTEDNALFEARRCLSCGNCFECDNCYGVCPDNAVIKLGPGKRFEFNYDYCKGCGMCAPSARAARSRWCRRPGNARPGRAHRAEGAPPQRRRAAPTTCCACRPATCPKPLPVAVLEAKRESADPAQGHAAGQGLRRLHALSTCSTSSPPTATATASSTSPADPDRTLPFADFPTHPT